MRTSTGNFKIFSRMIWVMALLLVVFTTGCDRDHGAAAPGAPGVDTTAPSVSVTSPTNKAIDVPVNRKVTIGFSEAMDPSKITTATIAMKETVSGNAVTGTVTSSGTSAIFSPAGNLAFSMQYTVTISTGAKDQAGNALTSNFVFTFTTGAVSDTIAPSVSVTSPANGSPAVPVNRIITIGFSEAMDPLTITTANITMKVSLSGTNIGGSVLSTGTSAIFAPSSNLAANENYTVTIGAGAKDLAGNALAATYVFTFTTAAPGVAPDTIKPTVSVTSPANLSTDVHVNRILQIGFSEDMDPLTITTANISVQETASAIYVMGTVAPTGTTATFSPISNLSVNTNYTVRVTTGAKDLAGNALEGVYEFTFTTSAAPDTLAPTVSVTSPADAAVAVPVNRIINIGFSEAMDPSTITTANITVETASGITVTGAVVPSGTSATFAPLSNLANSTSYTVTIASGAKDLAGNAMTGDYVFTFTTSAVSDTIAPTVNVTSPTDASVSVPINRTVTIGFSEAMDPLTITTANISMKETVSGNAVAGAVAASGASATFDPLANLANSMGYTVTITTGVRDLAGNAPAGTYAFTFTTVAPILAPTVSSTVPANNDTSVQINRRISATFSETMNPATISTADFTVTGPLASVVTGTVAYSGQTAVFTPASALAANTQYTAKITTAVQSLAGIAMASNHSWIFNTGLAADTTAPTLISTGTASGATGLPVNRNDTATFSEPMDPATIVSPAITFTVKEFVSGNTVTGVVTYIGNTATFNPDSDLSFNTKYLSTITTGAKDLAGNALVSGLTVNPWSWTTGAAPDTLKPTVTITNPANLATNVSVNKQINATFSEAMDQASLSTANYTVKETATGNNVTGTVAYDVLNNIATFMPQASLTPDTDYTVTVTSGAKDLAGNTLIVPATGGLPKPNPWTFRTAAGVIPPQALAVNLRGAATFGIASRAGLTSTGVTVVNGDVALYPLATCTDSTGNLGASQSCLVKVYTSPTGLTVNGSVYYAGDPFDNGGTANSVTNDLNIAWTEAMNKVDTQGAIAADEMGGKTFIPGVYHNANLGLAANGVATLDAQNDANAIFIFKVDSTFVDSGTLLLPTRIDLINGAVARNVWFVTGLDITIGSGSTWKGNILAGRTVVINNGSTVLGRVLGGASGAGAITLTGAASPSITTITVPQ